jgi:hypothetical protein
LLAKGAVEFSEVAPLEGCWGGSVERGSDSASEILLVVPTATVVEFPVNEPADAIVGVSALNNITMINSTRYIIRDK